MLDDDREIFNMMMARENASRRREWMETYGNLVEADIYVSGRVKVGADQTATSGAARHRSDWRISLRGERKPGRRQNRAARRRRGQVAAAFRADSGEFGDALTLGRYARAHYLQYAIARSRAARCPRLRRPEAGAAPHPLLHVGHAARRAGTHAHARARAWSATCSASYHPHGDQAVYDALVRMAQDFTLRYPLIDGQGNFGSRDGDGAAAYALHRSAADAIRRAAARRDRPGHGGLRRPTTTARAGAELLPARLPLVLLNGASGIAVGMATEIPPHNLHEVAQAARRDDPRSRATHRRR